MRGTVQDCRRHARSLASRSGSGLGRLEPRGRRWRSVADRPLLLRPASASGDIFDAHLGRRRVRTPSSSPAPTRSPPSARRTRSSCPPRGDPRGDHPTGPACPHGSASRRRTLTLPTPPTRWTRPALDGAGPDDGRRWPSPGPGTAASGAVTPWPVANASPRPPGSWATWLPRPRPPARRPGARGRHRPRDGGGVTRPPRSSRQRRARSAGAPPAAPTAAASASPVGAPRCVAPSASGGDQRWTSTAAGSTDGAFEPRRRSSAACARRHPLMPATTTAAACSPMERVRLRRSEPVAAELLVVRGCADRRAGPSPSRPTASAPVDVGPAQRRRSPPCALGGAP